MKKQNYHFADDIIIYIKSRGTYKLLKLLRDLEVRGKRTCLSMQGMQETQVQSLGGEDPWSRKWQPDPGFLPGKFHGQRSLAEESIGSQELDKTQQLSIHIDTHIHMVQKDCLVEKRIKSIKEKSCTPAIKITIQNIT